MNAHERLRCLSLAVLDADDELMKLGYRLDLVNNVFAGCAVVPTDEAVSFSLAAIAADLNRLREALDTARNSALAGWKARS